MTNAMTTWRGEPGQGPAHQFDWQAFNAWKQANPGLSGRGGPYMDGTGENAQVYNSMPLGVTGGSYNAQGLVITPLADEPGNYVVYRGSEPGKASRLNGTMADKYDAQGKYLGKYELKGITDNNAGKDFITGAMMMAPGMYLTAAGAGAGAAAGAAGSTGSSVGGSGGGNMFGVGMDGAVQAGQGFNLSPGASFGAETAAMGGAGELAGAAGGAGGSYFNVGMSGIPEAGTGFNFATPAMDAAGIAPAYTYGGAAIPGAGIPLSGGAVGGLSAMPDGLAPPPGGPGGGATPAGTTPNPVNPVTQGSFNWTDLVGAAVAATGGLVGADAAKDAAEAQAEAQREAAALSEPWRKAGETGLNRLQELLGIGGDPNAADYGSASKGFGEAAPAFQEWNKAAPEYQNFGERAPSQQLAQWQGRADLAQFQDDPELAQWAGTQKFTAADLEQDPGYQFRLQEGQKALERSAAARGGLFSGAAGKALTGYAQGMASQEYGNAWNRAQQTRTNKLQDYLTNRDTSQLNRGNKVQSYTLNRDTAQLSRGNALQDYTTNRETSQLNRSNQVQDFNDSFNRYQTEYGNRTNAYNNEYARFASERGARQDDYNQRFNRFYTERSNRLAPLQSLAGLGQTAAGTIGGYTAAAGDANAAGRVGSTNAIVNAISNGWNMYQSGQNRQYENALMERLLAPRGN